jgi:hypothetical protein
MAEAARRDGATRGASRPMHGREKPFVLRRSARSVSKHERFFDRLLMTDN